MPAGLKRNRKSWLKSLRRSLRVPSHFWLPKYHNNCLRCGFLAFTDGSEVPDSARKLIAARGQAEWFSDQAPFDCFKNMWDGDFHDSAFDTIIEEANAPRRFCPGFCSWNHGRTPADHIKLEDEQRAFRHQNKLAWKAFWGALIGALIGAAVTVYTIRHK